jgi:DNA-packaging protein gp3
MDNNGQAWKLDEHWKVINSGGRQVSNTPQMLWEQAVEYFKWCDDHPVKAKRTLTSGKTQGDKVTVEFNRPYSIKGFCLHCSISERYISDIKNTHLPDSEWVMVVEKILMIIYTQNLEGAIVDLYNPIMVSKVLNMDKHDNTDDKPVRIEITSSQSETLANSENEVLKKLDSEKLETLKDKTENFER